MDHLLLLILLWGGFLLMLWALRAGLGEVEGSLEPNAAQPDPAQVQYPQRSFDKPDAETEVIGQYMNVPIHRSITIAGIEYRYDHIEPPGNACGVHPNERCVAPGIVYIACQ